MKRSYLWFGTLALVLVATTSVIAYSYHRQEARHRLELARFELENALLRLHFQAWETNPDSRKLVDETIASLSSAARPIQILNRDGKGWRDGTPLNTLDNQVIRTFDDGAPNQTQLHEGFAYQSVRFQGGCFKCHISQGERQQAVIKVAMN